MNVPHIEIKQKGIATEIFIDGQKVKGVRKVSFERDFTNLAPVLQLEFLATDMSIDGVIVPDLPDALKPFYEKKDCPTE